MSDSAQRFFSNCFFFFLPCCLSGIALQSGNCLYPTVPLHHLDEGSFVLVGGKLHIVMLWICNVVVRQRDWGPQLHLQSWEFQPQLWRQRTEIVDAQPAHTCYGEETLFTCLTGLCLNGATPFLFPLRIPALFPFRWWEMWNSLVLEFFSFHPQTAQNREAAGQTELNVNPWSCHKRSSKCSWLEQNGKAAKKDLDFKAFWQRLH